MTHVRHWAGRAGELVRLVVGADAPPAFRDFAPDAPAFTRAADAASFDGDRFTLTLPNAGEVRGTVHAEPFSVDVDVGDAEIFGFGSATGAPTRNGARFRILTLDTLFFGIEGSSYTALPVFFARDARGLMGFLVVTTFPLDAEIAGGRVRLRACCDTEGAAVDVVAARGAPADVLRAFARLIGTTYLPPAWALGFHQSRWSYKTADAVVEVGKRLRAEDLPADVVHLDIHYMDHFRVFTWSPERFPQPKQMHEELRALGLRTMAIVDPGVSATPYPVYEEGTAQGLWLKKRDGTAYTGKVWPGATVFPDFTSAKVRDAWAGWHRQLVDAGVGGIWNDMNDPVLKVAKVYDPLGEDIEHADGSHRKLRNTYANEMARATQVGLRAARPGKRPFVLTRSGFLGIQQHAAVWTGDNYSSWEQLEEGLYRVLNLGLSGVTISGADVGGFGGRRGLLGMAKLRPSPELFVRWMELGALLPFFRVHCVLYAPRQEPWSFGKRALDLSRKILRRRYRLLPLWYRLALEAHETGLPLVRPLWLHHDVPRDRAQDQLLIGDALLAAPVMRPGETKRDVWLPAGSWVDFDSGDVVAGGRVVTREAPLGTTPLFVRAGAALFLAEPKRNADETLRAPLALEITAPPAGQAGHGSLFLDDGERDDGERFLLDVDVVDAGGKLRVRFSRTGAFAPVQHDLELRAPRAFTHAVVDGKRIAMTPCELLTEDRRASVSTVRVPLSAHEIVLE